MTSEDGDITIPEAILQIATSISNAQCSPPGGAKYPFELFVNLHFDDESREAINQLADAMRDIADAIRERQS